MKSLLVLLAALAVAYAASVGTAHLTGTAGNEGINGLAYFVQDGENVWVWVNITGITANPTAEHGLHVHAYGDLTDPGANTAGGHYVGAGNSTHACEDVTPRHEGDMGNWQATDGVITGTKTLNLLATWGNFSIIGKAIVLHSGVDDCVSQPAGNASSRIAVGVIGIANYAYLPQAVIDQLGGTAPTSNDAISADPTVIKAVAVLTPTVANSSFPNVRGIVSFEQDASGAITITGWFTGLASSGQYGLHIHTFADYYTNGVVSGTAAGGHFTTNSTMPHGAPTNSSRHAGDLGNICTFDGAGANAYYKWVMNDGKFSLNGENNILGRNLIIHSAFDTMTPTSAFGDRVSQGVIGVTNTTATGIVTIPAAITPRSPLCSLAPTSAPTAAPTAAPSTTSLPSSTTSSSSSVVVVCYTALLALLAVVLF